jgi:glycosyltransferase involved in cell wall biosynthesis
VIDLENPDYGNTPASPSRPEFSYALADPTAPPQVTIVTPFYNEGPVFHETARSILRQSFQQWEWIIVNDASTDTAALEVLAGYRTMDRRIRVVDQTVNQGPSAARNVAFLLARTDCVANVDSDNLLEPTALEKWLWYLEAHPECSFVKGFSVGFGSKTYLWTAGFHDGPAFLTANRVDMTTMMRREVHRAVGGFDESIREGLEDWDFWLRCASRGFWGGTVPEYLDWYRRRASHADRWKAWDDGERERRFRQEMRRRYPSLWDDGFPEVRQPAQIPNATIPDTLPVDNRLARSGQRLLIIAPWLTMGGSDKFTLDLVRELTRGGWEITIATTLDASGSWQAEFERHTPDVFLLHRFLALPSFPRFLRYLAQSRQVEAVLVTHSELGYQLLPYLRAHLSGVSFLDYCHIEEEWKNGGYPRLSVEYQELFDANVASSESLKQWMIGRGADAERIQVCHTNIDTDVWRPDANVRREEREKLELDDATPVILYAARICDQKQPRVFANALLRLRQMSVSFVALVAGDGPDFGWLRRFVSDNRLRSHVHLFGAVPLGRVNRLMKAADIFFLPSAREGIALSIYEAMASGVAVVAADVGGQAELVTPDCGILVGRTDERGEAEAYARALADLAADPARRQALGRAGRARMEAGFRLEDMGRRMVEIIDLAATLHDTEPRPGPGLGLGRACAAQAVEFTRFTREFDMLWHAWEGGRAAAAPGLPAGRVRWRERVYAACRVLYAPLYRRGVERGGAWYFPIAERIKRWLVQDRIQLHP